MYHDFISHQQSNSFKGRSNLLKEQQQQSLQSPRSNVLQLTSNNKYQHFMQIQPQLILAQTKATLSSIFPPNLSEENLRDSSQKLLPSKLNSTPSNIILSSQKQDDSDATIISKSRREGNAQHSIRYDSETSSGTSESLSGFSLNSIPQKLRVQQDSNSSKVNTEEQIDLNNQSKIKFDEDSHCKRATAQASQILVKQNKYTEIPRGQREIDPFQYIFEQNTFCSENLLINSMAQANKQLLQQISTQTNNLNPLETDSSNQSLTCSTQIKLLNTQIPQVGTQENESSKQLSFYIKESQENILEVQSNKHTSTTLTLQVKRQKKINKKKEKLKKINKSYLSKDNISSQLDKLEKKGNRLSLQQTAKVSKNQRDRKNYFYQDPEIENYVGEEFQAVIPDIIPGYKPQLYSLKYDHSRVSNENFRQVTSYLQQTYGKCVTDEDVANIITETGYDITQVSALIEKKKYYYDTYFSLQKRLHSQRKGQVKRIGTLKRKKKNVLTL